MHEAVLQEDDRARLGFGETCMKQLRVCPECGQLAAPGEPRLSRAPAGQDAL